MQNKILKEIEALGLVEKFSDRRKKTNQDAVIVSPVGNKQQFLEFVSHVKKLGIEKKADFLFIIKKDLSLPKTTLSEVRCYEAIRIGTSGAFFIGQVIAYKLGYEIIVIADTDAYLDSQKTFDEMYELCKKCQKVIVPKSIATEAKIKSISYVLNQWSFFPRKIFETVGFSCPYFWYGGEDYELLYRCKKYGVIFFYDEGNVFHPVNTHTIFYKLINKKQNLYVIGLLKSILFISKYNIVFIFKYIIWRCYYAFFSDLFQSNDLSSAIKKTYQLILPEFYQKKKYFFEIKKTKQKGGHITSSSKILHSVYGLISLLTFGYFDWYNCRIIFMGDRTSLFIDLIKASILLPIRFIESLIAVLKFNINFAKLKFPPTIYNLKEVIHMYKNIITKKRIC